MLKSVKTKTIIKTIVSSFVGLAIGTGIGLGYHFSKQSNPYSEFFKRPTNYGDVSLELSYQAAVLNGASVLVGAGFTHNSVISKINSQPNFKDASFLGIDVSFGGKDGWNVSTVNFKTEQSGFFAALAAAEYLNQNQSFFMESDNDYLSYSVWGGISGQSVDSYLSGFEQGIIYFNNNILPKLSNTKTSENKKYKKIYLAMPSKFYAGGFGVGDANGIIDEIISGNCKLLEANGKPYQENKLVKPDIVFPVAGPQTATLVTKIYTNNLNMAVIGVDTAMELDPMTTKVFNIKNNLPKINGKDCKSIIPFSAIKDMENSTAGILNNILNGVTNGKTSKNGFGGLGWYSVGDIQNNGAGISKNGEQLIVNLMKQANLLSGSNDYNAVKKYFTNNYNIADPTKLTTTVINGIGSYSKYTPLRETGWLIEPNKGESSEAFKKREIQFENKVNVFANQMSKKLTSLQEKTNKSEFQNSVKIILSTPNSVLFDHSFSETTYLGLYKFYKNNGAPIPEIK